LLLPWRARLRTGAAAPVSTRRPYSAAAAPPPLLPLLCCCWALACCCCALCACELQTGTCAPRCSSGTAPLNKGCLAGAPPPDGDFAPSRAPLR
jgi:hypothetical protein